MQLQHIDIHSVHPQSSRCSRVAMETCRWICTLVVVAFFNGFMIQCLFCVLCAGSVEFLALCVCVCVGGLCWR